MVCDRCVLNVGCEMFSPGGECVKEKEAYDWLVGELTRQYGLDEIADQIHVWRVAMYLIRIARAETYESLTGVTKKSALWGAYISRLDNTLRALLNDMRISRLKRRQLEKRDELMVDVENLLKNLTERAVEKRRVVVRKTTLRIKPLSVYRKVLAEWRKEKEHFNEDMRRT